MIAASRFRTACSLVAAVLVGACGGGDPAADEQPMAAAASLAAWQPRTTDTWQWQLTGTVNTGYDVEVYDIDLFETPSSVIRSLKMQGRRVVCYFSAGGWRSA